MGLRLKKYLSALLIAMMILTAAPLQVFASDENPSAEQETAENAQSSETGLAYDSTVPFADQLKNGYQPAAQKVDLKSLYDEAEKVTVIVELESAPLIGSKPGNRTFSLGKSTLEAEHDSVKNAINSLMRPSLMDNVMSLFSEENKEDGEAELNVLYDYYVVMNGFAAEVPYRYLAQIQELDGVKTAYIESSYEVPNVSSETHVANSTGMIGTGLAAAEGYTGKGTAIAIVDSGLDWKHSAFSASNLPVGLKYSADMIGNAIFGGKLKASSITGNLSTEDVYQNGKVPFAYDYADKDVDAIPSNNGSPHGTHVAGIAAANSDKLRGVAPDAQIVALKVFSDVTGNAYDSDILAALEDAVTLNVDSINMSLGASAGFSSAGEASKDAVYQRISNSGIGLSVSAGNSYSSSYGNQSGYGLPYASEPDNSILAAPSSYAAALSVASMINVKTPDSRYFKAGTREIGFYDASDEKQPKIWDLNGTCEYLWVGYGSVKEIDAAGNLSGKVALVLRGNEISFEDKVKNCYSKGAKAVVVANNVNGTLKMSISKYYIPAVSVGKDEGEYLRGLETKSIVFDKTFVKDMPSEDAYRMSGFSSWGVTPDLKLKPEVTAPGENIYSSMPGEQYESMSGTSMAAPHVAGADAVMKQFLNQKYAGYSASEKLKLMEALLMSTATPAIDEEDEYYSPRKQGAGLINLNDAIHTKAYLTTGASGRPKAELGDNQDGSFDFEFTIHNLSGQPLAYTLDSVALTEKIIERDGKEFFAQKSKNYAESEIKLTYTGEHVNNRDVVVPANASTSVGVHIRITEELKNLLYSLAPAGTFIDGFVMMNAADGAKLSLPYMGFMGDWSKPKIFDRTGYDKNGYSIFGSVPYNNYSNGGAYTLGQNHVALAIDGQGFGIEEDKFVISPRGYVPVARSLGTQTGLLRNAEKLEYTITDKDQNIVKAYSFNNVAKSYYHDSAGVITWAEAFLNPVPSFDGLDQNGDEVPEGMYTYTVRATPAGTGGNGVQEWTFNFAYDKTPPKVASYEIDQENGILNIVVEDNHYVSGYELLSQKSNLTGLKALRNPDETKEGKNYYNLQLDLDDLKEKLQVEASGGVTADSVLIDIYDYALNYSRVDISLNIVDAETITITPDSADIFAGQELKLAATVMPETTTFKEVEWSSSNPSIATVDANGIVSGIAAGGALITAKTKNGITATAAITVKEVSEEQGIVLNYSEYTLVDGDSLPLKATVAPSLKETAVVWNSSDERIAVVDNAGKVMAKNSGTVTITASAGQKTVNCVITVLDYSSDDFIIENGVLVRYNGFGGRVKVPKTVTEIGYEAFAYWQGVTSVTLPASVIKIADRAFYGCMDLENITFEGEALTSIGAKAFSGEGVVVNQIRELELPDSVTEIGENAFAICPNLQRIKLPKNLERIPAGMFYYDYALNAVTMPKNLKEIGSMAFASTSALQSLELPDTLEKLGKSTFMGTAFSSITIPEGITEIPMNAFQGSRLSSVTFGSNVETIRSNAFAATPLTEVIIPNKVSVIEDNAFAYCSNLTSFHLGSAVKDMTGAALEPGEKASVLTTITVAADNPFFDEINGVLFTAGSGKTLVKYPSARKEASYTIPSDVEHIGITAFKNSDNLKEIIFIHDVDIRTKAFSHCDSLKKVEIGDGIGVLIGESAFANCARLEEIKLGDRVKELGDYAFQWNSSLTAVDLGGVETVGRGAFQYAESLTEFSVSDHVISLGDSALANNYALRKVHFGKNLKTLGDGVFAMDGMISELTVDSQNPNFSSSGLLLTNKDMTEIVFYPVASSNKEVVIPETVTAIPDRLFQNAKLLERVILHSGIKTIGTAAFNGCAAATVIGLPEDIEEIGSFAFSDGPKLQAVNIGDKIKTINSFAFSNAKVEYFYIQGNQETVIDDLSSFAAPGLKGAYFGPDISLSKTMFDYNWGTGRINGDPILYGAKGSEENPSNVWKFANENHCDFVEFTAATAGIAARSVTEEGADSLVLTLKPSGGIGALLVKLSVKRQSDDSMILETEEFSSKLDYKVEKPEDGAYLALIQIKDGAGKIYTSEVPFSVGGTEALEDGRYSVPVDMWHATDETPSMMAPILAKTAYLTVNNGKKDLTIEFVKADLKVMGQSFPIKGQDITNVLYDYDGVSKAFASKAVVVKDDEQAGTRSFTLKDVYKEGFGDILVLAEQNLMPGSYKSRIRIDDSRLRWAGADNSTLTSLIEQGSALSSSEYSQSTWEKLLAALDAAKLVTQNLNASQQDVDAAVSALQNALDQLRPYAEDGQFKVAVNMWQKYEDNNSMMSPLLSPLAMVTAEDGEYYVTVEFVSAEIKIGTGSSMTISGTSITSLWYDYDERKATFRKQAEMVGQPDYEKGTVRYKFPLADIQKPMLIHPVSMYSPLTDVTKQTRLKIDADQQNWAWVNADTVELERLISEMKAIDKALYDQDTWNALLNAIAKAEAVLAQERITLKDVQKAFDSIRSAKEALRIAEGSYTIKTQLLEASDWGDWEAEINKALADKALLALEADGSARVIITLGKAAIYDKNYQQINVTGQNILDIHYGYDESTGEFCKKAEQISENIFEGERTFALQLDRITEPVRVKIDSDLAGIVPEKIKFALDLSTIEREGSVDKEQLAALLGKVETLSKGDYTEGSWASFESKLAEVLENARTVNENNDATESEVAGAITDLENAMALLVEYIAPGKYTVSVNLWDEKKDKVSETLSALISKKAVLEVENARMLKISFVGGGISSIKYGYDQEADQFNKSAEKLQAVGENSFLIEVGSLNQKPLIFVSGTDIDSRARLYIDPDSLKPYEDDGNKKELDQLIQNYQNTDENLYTEDSYKRFAAALENAQTVAGNSDASLADISLALENLRAAIAALVRNERATLKEDLNQFDAKFKEEEKSLFDSPETMNQVQAALEKAKAVADSEAATPEEIAKAGREIREVLRKAEISPSIITKDTALLAADRADMLPVELGDDWNVFRDELKAVTEALRAATAEGNQKNILEAYGKIKELASKMENLTVANAGSETLGNLITMAASLPQSKFTSESLSKLNGALDDGGRIIESLSQGGGSKGNTHEADCMEKQSIQDNGTETGTTLDPAETETEAFDNEMLPDTHQSEQTAADEADETEAVAEADAADEAEAVIESDEADEAEAVTEADAADEAEADTESDEADEADVVAESDAADEAEADTESDEADEADVVAESDAADEAEAVTESDAADQADEPAKAVKTKGHKESTPSRTENLEETGGSTGALASSIATASDINASVKALSLAILGLEEKADTADLKKLKTLVALSEMLKADDYTSSAWNSFEAALTAASNLGEEAGAYQVAAAFKTLTAEKSGLAGKANKAALSAEIQRAQTVDQSKYTSDSVAALNTSLAAAKVVESDENTKQSDVDQAVVALRNAIESLKLKGSDTPSGGGTSGGGSSEKKPAETVKTPEAVAEVQMKDIRGHWAEKQIQALIAKNILKGYEDDTFRPDGKMTRAEFIAVLVRALGLRSGGGRSGFEDISSHWAKNDIETAYNKGYISGTDKTRFNPNGLLTRQELAVILSKLIKTDQGETMAFSDQKDVAGWAVDGVQKLISSGLLKGYEDGSIRPQNSITRAEVATIIASMLERTELMAE